MPEMMSHPSAQALALFGHGKLSEAQAATVASHLETCPDCRNAIAGLPADSFLGKVKAAKPGGTILPSASSRPKAAPAAAAPGPAAPIPDLPPELAHHPKFRIVRELGRGGMGVIYLAEHRVLEKHVALKVIGPAVLDNPDALARFQAEVKAAGRLDHQNIARAFDADQAGDLHFLVMEFVEGLTLAQLLERRGPLPLGAACHLVSQAALGLQHAFEHGMAHRDIKPQNLMVTPRGLVKVLDFGLARVRDERKAAPRLTQLESFMGTPEYVAPEQATDARQADTRADVYSLGCTLYALLTGRPPFVEDTVVQVVLAHVEKEPQPLHELRPDVSPELSAVVGKMLAKDPAQRYQTPVEVARALAPFVKAGAKAGAGGGVSLPPGVASAKTGTLVGGDTSRLKGLGQGASKLPARAAGPAAVAAESPFHDLAGVPASGKTKPTRAARRKRPRAIAGVAVVVVALIVLLGVLIKVKGKPSRDDTGKRPDGALAASDSGRLHAPAQPPLSETDKARAEMERSRDEARKKLLSGFDAALKRLEKGGRQAAGAELIDVLKAERARFEKHGLLPWSEPMRPHMLAYLHVLRAARDAAANAYSAEIDEQLARKNEEKANRLRAELQGIQADEVVARWRHQINGFVEGSAVQSLYANGKIGDPDSDNSWTFEGGVLTLRWPNGNAPGGAWVDTCPVSPDGRTYSGENQLKVPISGVYSEDE